MVKVHGPVWHSEGTRVWHGEGTWVWHGEGTQVWHGGGTWVWHGEGTQVWHGGGTWVWHGEGTQVWHGGGTWVWHGEGTQVWHGGGTWVWHGEGTQVWHGGGTWVTNCYVVYELIISLLLILGCYGVFTPEQHDDKTMTRQRQDKCWTCAFLWCLSHRHCWTWWERHHRNAQVQHLSCRGLALVWKHHCTCLSTGCFHLSSLFAGNKW